MTHRRRRLPRRHPVRAGSADGRQRDERRHGDPQTACWPTPGRKPVGKMVIGTVKGDIHDIGKNLVGDDDGRRRFRGDRPRHRYVRVPTSYLAALEEQHSPDILGMSALLTTTMPYMKVVIDTLVEKGMREDFIVLVGGAPLNEEFGKAVGADAYCRDAAVAVETAQNLIAEKRAA